jgi:hypothetical protein
LDLARWRNREPISARPVSAAEKFWSWCRRKPALATSLFSIVILLLVVIIGSPIAVFRINRERQRAEKLRQQSDRRAYASEMNLVQRALEMNTWAAPRLAGSLPAHKQSEVDLRGWEWRYLWNQCRAAESVFATQMRSCRCRFHTMALGWRLA